MAIQLVFTGRIISRLGLPLALSALPAVAATMLLGIAAAPVPAMVATAEVQRKVRETPLLLAYSLSYPTSTRPPHCSARLRSDRDRKPPQWI